MSPTAVRESLTISSADKLTPELLSHLSTEDLTRTIQAVQEEEKEEEVPVTSVERDRTAEGVVRRVSPKDDIFASGYHAGRPSIAEAEIQQETTRDAVRDSFQVETSPSKIAPSVVPAEIVIPAVVAQKEYLEILTHQRHIPESVDGLDTQEFIRTPSQVPTEETTQELRERETIVEIDHRVSPKDDVFQTTVEFVSQPPVDQVQVERETSGEQERHICVSSVVGQS